MTFTELLSRFERFPPAVPDDLAACERTLGRPLPLDLRNFLLASNGGEGPIGEGYLSLWRVETLESKNAAHAAATRFPGLFLIGTDGGAEAFALDLEAGQTTYVMVPIAGRGRADMIELGHTFREFISSFDHWTASDD